MSKKKKKRQARPPKLPKALQKELDLQHLTYEEAIAGCDDVPSPGDLLTLLRGWRLLTPQQKAAWDDAARRYNLSGGWTEASN